MKLIVDPSGGFSGDMFISGLISLGADYEKIKDILIYAGKFLGDIKVNKTITIDGSTRLILQLKPSKDYIKGSDASIFLEKIYDKFKIKEKYKDFGRNILNNLMTAEKKAHSENIFNSDKYLFKPIGKILSNLNYKGNDSYVIEIFDKYSLGLEEIEQFSHIYIISFLNRSTGYSLNVTPPWEDRNIKVGVFSSRSPNRPNPIGLNTVKLYGKVNNFLYTEPFDIYLNTPVIDIKPVIGSIDKNSKVNDGWIVSDKHLNFHKKGIPHKHDNEDSYLHEAQDILIDISGAVLGMQLLNIDINGFIINEVSLGDGEIWTSHGKLSVPAPATLNIIEKFNIPHLSGPIKKELCTPTGASILSALHLKYDKNIKVDNSIKGYSRGSKDYDIPPLVMYMIK